MKILRLDQQQPECTVRAAEEKMNTEILKVILTGPLPPQPLQLEVADENGFLLYTKPLVPRPQLPDSVPVKEHPEVPVNKRFIFNNQLTIRVLGPPGIAFSAEVHIV